MAHPLRVALAAVVVPDPIVSEYERLGFFALSAPENVVVSPPEGRGDGEGDGEGLGDGGGTPKPERVP